jgi:large subunit ribosomal protein L31
MIITCGTLLIEIIHQAEQRHGPIEVFQMQNAIHPEYKQITATCSCGNVVNVGSTVCKDITLDICGACHPFYTGTQRVVDTGGRIDKFKKRFGALASK